MQPDKVSNKSTLTIRAVILSAPTFGGHVTPNVLLSRAPSFGASA
jgi:hypothetical protein